MVGKWGWMVEDKMINGGEREEFLQHEGRLRLWFAGNYHMERILNRATTFRIKLSRETIK